MWNPPSTLAASSSGCSATHSSGEISDVSTPHAVAQPWRRFSSVSRSGVVATSRPPTASKQPSSPYLRAV
jgi:hypothetical protein